MKQKKFFISILMTVIVLSTLTSCNLMGAQFSNIKSALKGRYATIQTYDDNSMPIDRVHGTAIDVDADGKFDLKDSDGSTIKMSSVISIIVGKHTMQHVGSSLIIKEDGLVDYFNEFSKKVDINNYVPSTPILTNLVSNFDNLTTGKKKVLLIRSQTGKPLATFAGKSVSYFPTEIDKSTAFYIDGKFLFVYRCDYTVYDSELLTTDM